MTNQTPPEQQVNRVDRSQQADTRPRILFVDDSQLMIQSVQRILRPNFDLLTAEDGVKAWEILTADPTVQVLFSDLAMPHMDGYELLGKVRASEDPRLRDMPVIIVTSHDEESARERALREGATDFISKPFKPSELLARAEANATSEESSRRLRLIETRSTTDPATGLGNRVCFVDRLAQEMSFARRQQQQLALLHLRIDRFEKLFMKLGRLRAEKMLRHLGELLGRRLRKGDMLCRNGLGVFGLIMPGCERLELEQLKVRLRQDVESVRFRSGQHILKVGCTLSEQIPDLNGIDGPEELLQAGLSELEKAPVPTEPVAARPQPAKAPPPSIEEALAMIEAGRSEALRRHLPALMEKLEPLLRLARDAEPRQRAGGGLAPGFSRW